ncbi:hypothetical protein [Kitasatospora sp. NPDC051914]|uniref:hypothetical protein n=1 Tax=Kitasatospora sp. NPDC051914 TaxID=3154945 RepID=UPI003438911B
MATARTTARTSGLPASLTPALLARLAARVTANAPYTGAPLAALPVSTPADVGSRATPGCA